MSAANATPRTTGIEILGYSLGEGANSLTMNGIGAYAMLYYTQALGLPFSQAAIAFAVSSVWDAVIDPAIGHLSDNTHTRWGRRQPLIILGGVLMAVCFYYMWAVPDFVTRGGMLFIYVLAINLAYRTFYAVYYVPYLALGFEVCTDYHRRSQLQGGRAAFNMLANILGPALGWTLFFPDRPGGREATSVASNYILMGSVFTVATLLFVGAVALATRRHIVDTRGLVTGTGNTVRAFVADFKEIIMDRYLRPIVTMMCVGLTGAVFVATLQMYLYVYFMHLTSHQKTIVHGGGMVLFGTGALLGSLIERRFDKKLSVCIGAGTAAVADLAAAVIFLGGILKPTTPWVAGGHVIPVAVIVFGGCDMVNWLGVGLYTTIGTSMLADVAEVDELRSGLRKDGGYAAMFSFITKLVQSVAIFGASACLAWVGFVPGSDRQTPESIRWLVLLAFGLGSLFAALVIPIALRYPIDQPFMRRVKGELAVLRARAAGGAAPG